MLLLTIQPGTRMGGRPCGTGPGSTYSTRCKLQSWGMHLKRGSACHVAGHLYRGKCEDPLRGMYGMSYGV